MMRRLPSYAFLVLPLLLAACGGQQNRKDTPRMSDCQVLKLTPEYLAATQAASAE